MTRTFTTFYSADIGASSSVAAKKAEDLAQDFVGLAKTLAWMSRTIYNAPEAIGIKVKMFLKKITAYFLALFLGIAYAHAMSRPPQETVDDLPELEAEVTEGMPLPRDGEIAIKEQYDTAVNANTVEALELFIARHPGHPLAAQAAKMLENIR